MSIVSINSDDCSYLTEMETEAQSTFPKPLSTSVAEPGLESKSCDLAHMFCGPCSTPPPCSFPWESLLAKGVGAAAVP